MGTYLLVDPVGHRLPDRLQAGLAGSGVHSTQGPLAKVPAVAAVDWAAADVGVADWLVPASEPIR
jgi:hypothetical protein